MKRILLLACIFLHGLTMAQFTLGPDQTLCPGQTITLSPFVTGQVFEDTLIITYNATLGQTALPGANKVYFHSSYESVPFAGPVNPWIGNWGMDDGVGLMDSIGQDLWQIRIHVRNYYSIPQGTALNGLFMVFRNSDGTLTGKDDNGNDIFLLLGGAQPSSAFSGVTGTILSDAIESVLWNDGSTSNQLSVSQAASYWVSITDTTGTLFVDTIILNAPAASLNLGPDLQICSGTINFNLNAGTGFSSYLWSTSETTQSILITATGTYSITATVAGCIDQDTIIITQGPPSIPVSLGSDTAVCGLASYVFNPSINIGEMGDSLELVYDATQGQTQLSGVAPVYIHIGVQTQPGGGWNYVVGNWGQNDGIGLMTSIGNNLWRLKINPLSYFGYPAGTQVYGYWMVFRNEDGSLTGKDNNGNDIYVSYASGNATSTFSGLTSQYTPAAFASILWNTGATSAAITITQSGIYTAILTASNGCTQSDSVEITLGQIPFVDAGSGQNLCPGETITLDAGPGFQSYSWSTGQSTQSILIDTAGVYSITVTNNSGCSGIDVVTIVDLPLPVASFTFVQGVSNLVNFTNTSSNASSVSWDFTNDGTFDSFSQNPFYTYTSGPGSYTVRLVAVNSCGADTLLFPLLVSSVDEQSHQGTFILYPNPAVTTIFIEGLDAFDSGLYEIFSLTGSRLIQGQITPDLATSGISLPSSLESGMYVLQLTNANRTFLIRKLFTTK